MTIKKTPNSNIFVKSTKKIFLKLMMCFIISTAFLNISTAKDEKEDKACDYKNGIDYENITKYFESFDLKKHDEDFKGYTFAYHIGKSKDWLEGRMSGERHKNFVSSYTDVETANRVIKEIIIENEKNIKEWLDKTDDKKRIVFHKKFDEKIGMIVEKGEKESKDCNIGVVVLKRTQKHSKKFFIVTSYPVSNAIKIDEISKSWKDNKGKKYEKYAMAFN